VLTRMYGFIEPGSSWKTGYVEPSDDDAALTHASLLGITTNDYRLRNQSRAIKLFYRSVEGIHINRMICRFSGIFYCSCYRYEQSARFLAGMITSLEVPELVV